MNKQKPSQILKTTFFSFLLIALTSCTKKSDKEVSLGALIAMTGPIESMAPPILVTF